MRRAMRGGMLVATVMALALGLAVGRPADASVLDGLVGHWTFDSGGSLGSDASGNANNGTVNGAVNPAAGVIGAGGADFAGGYINVPDSASLDSAAGSGLDRTVAFWFNTAVGSNLVVLEKGSNQHFVVQTEGGGAAGQISWRVNTASGNRIFSNNPVNDSTWHHYAATYDGVGNRTGLYIDGTPQATGSEGSAAANNDPFVIGARNGGGFAYLGDMDDLAVWSRS